mmetsp:Transcript_52163/g.93046  ORF Transcript_52163/g.93046 Transcript_52163/m.93046 type:complete len:152 (+) Transcript_52163:959-1414(+)
MASVFLWQPVQIEVQHLVYDFCQQPEDRLSADQARAVAREAQAEAAVGAEVPVQCGLPPAKLQWERSWRRNRTGQGGHSHTGARWDCGQVMGSKMGAPEGGTGSGGSRQMQKKGMPRGRQSQGWGSLAGNGVVGNACENTHRKPHTRPRDG